MNKEFILSQIKEMEKQEQIHFANWQRVQGAKIAYQQMLEHMEKEEVHMPDNKNGMKSPSEVSVGG